MLLSTSKGSKYRNQSATASYRRSLNQGSTVHRVPQKPWQLAKIALYSIWVHQPFRESIHTSFLVSSARIEIVAGCPTTFTVFPVKLWTPEKISGVLFFYDQSDAKWNRKRLRTNCSRDQSRLDTKQWAGPFFYGKSSIFPLYLSEKANFYHRPTLVTWFCLLENQTTELT